MHVRETWVYLTLTKSSYLNFFPHKDYMRYNTFLPQNSKFYKELENKMKNKV